MTLELVNVKQTSDIANGESAPTTAPRRPIIVLCDRQQSSTQQDYALLSGQLALTLVADDKSPLSPEELEDVIHSSGHSAVALLCEGERAAIGLQCALAAPHLVRLLVLKAPRVPVDAQYREIATPTLILEPSNVPEASLGQQLSAMMPNAYHVLVFEGGDTLNARPEAMAEVISDFVERGNNFIMGKSTALIHP